MSSEKKWGLKKKLLLACGIIVFTLLLLEIAGTTFAYFFYPRLVVSDDAIGWKYKPTAGPIQRHDRGGRVNNVDINREGFRDNEFTTDEDFLRIMILGDSTTFGLEADQAEIYPILVEQMLQEKLGNPKIDVLNFGITGFNNAQELACLKKYEPKYHPQVVVLQVTEWNDFSDNSRIYRGRYMPHFLLKDGEFVETNQPSVYYKILSLLRDHSTVFYLITHNFDFLAVTQELTDEQTIDLTFHILKQIHQYTQDKGILFYMIYVRDAEHATDKYEAIQAFVEEQGILFKMIPTTEADRVAGIGHWNGKGHRKAAEVVTEVLTLDPRFLSKAGAGRQE